LDLVEERQRRSGPLRPSFIDQYDCIILSYDHLGKEFYHVKAEQYVVLHLSAESSARGVEVVNIRSMARLIVVLFALHLFFRATRRHQRYKVRASELSMLSWWRLCLDEVHKLGRGASEKIKMAQYVRVIGHIALSDF
jgi:hypothetical protein